ncbi:MAG: DUF255 domain-containing protein [Gordonia sp. (in: high G+C Gram-positive bacteria)]
MANRLTAATSPYLRQHADNPLRWGHLRRVRGMVASAACLDR